MSYPFPFRQQPDHNKHPKKKRRESPWQRAWRHSPERMREHITNLNNARVRRSEQTAELVQAVLNMLPIEPVPPYKLRDDFCKAWNECYSENKTTKEAWNLLRLAMRHGMIGRTEKNLIYPRHA
jgi:type I site-specific restriction endonuclease